MQTTPSQIDCKFLQTNIILNGSTNRITMLDLQQQMKSKSLLVSTRQR